MAHLLRVEGSAAAACERISMAEAGLREAEHLEPWVKAHPEVIDDSLMVVAT